MRILIETTKGDDSAEYINALSKKIGFHTDLRYFGDTEHGAMWIIDDISEYELSALKKDIIGIKDSYSRYSIVTLSEIEWIEYLP